MTRDRRYRLMWLRLLRHIREDRTLYQSHFGVELDRVKHSDLIARHAAADYALRSLQEDARQIRKVTR